MESSPENQVIVFLAPFPIEEASGLTCEEALFMMRNICESVNNKAGIMDVLFFGDKDNASLQTTKVLAEMFKDSDRSREVGIIPANGRFWQRVLQDASEKESIANEALPYPLWFVVGDGPYLESFLRVIPTDSFSIANRQEFEHEMMETGFCVFPIRRETLICNWKRSRLMCCPRSAQ